VTDGSVSAAQRATCEIYGAVPAPTLGVETAGVADSVIRGNLPLNGLRHPSPYGVSGWYLWAGEVEIPQGDAGFFKPHHVHHLDALCPLVVPYLALPPGWRILLAPGYADVWFDVSLLRI
jgi:hypothetical protein